jgi:thymidylate synthase (FAD)
MTRQTVLDYGHVELIDITPNAEDRIVIAARQSTQAGLKSPEADAKLLHYLACHRHTSPFEMVTTVWQIRAPLFVARQWMRHRTGSFNEKSLRYVEETALEFHVPTVWRKQSITNKQASEGAIDEQDLMTRQYRTAIHNAIKAYNVLIANGVAREQARMVLPVSLYTDFMWRTDLHNLLRFLSLRAKANAQLEIQAYANAIYDLLAPHFTVFNWRRDNYHDKGE